MLSEGGALKRSKTVQAPTGKNNKSYDPFRLRRTEARPGEGKRKVQNGGASTAGLPAASVAVGGVVVPAHGRAVGLRATALDISATAHRRRRPPPPPPPPPQAPPPRARHCPSPITHRPPPSAHRPPPSALCPLPMAHDPRPTAGPSRIWGPEPPGWPRRAWPRGIFTARDDYGQSPY